MIMAYIRIRHGYWNYKVHDISNWLGYHLVSENWTNIFIIIKKGVFVFLYSLSFYQAWTPPQVGDWRFCGKYGAYEWKGSCWSGQVEICEGYMSELRLRKFDIKWLQLGQKWPHSLRGEPTNAKIIAKRSAKIMGSMPYIPWFPMIFH